jgi:hypothetical protein
MGRNAEIEKIFEKWWESSHCTPSDRAKLQSELNALLDAVVKKSNGLCSRQQLRNGLWPRYKEYRKERFKKESVQVAQTAMKQ